MERPTGFKIDPRLTEHIGPGPWDIGSHGVRDDAQDILDHNLVLHNLDVLYPVPGNKRAFEVERFFIRIPELVTYFYGTPYKFDLYTTTEIISATGRKDDAMLYSVMESMKKEHKIPANLVLLHNSFTLTKDLNQIRLAALNLQDKLDKSMESLTVLHNVARMGQRLAVVAAHGRAYLTKKGIRLAVKNEFGSENAADVMAKDFANIREKDGRTKRYAAVYFSSCNYSEYFPEEIYGDVEAVGIPVVAHTAKHYSDGKAARTDIFWPKN